MPPEITLFLQLVREQGIGLALAIVIVVGWLRGWVISAQTHHEMVARIEEELRREREDKIWWRQACLEAQNVATETQETAREVIRPGTGRRPPGGSR